MNRFIFDPVIIVYYLNWNVKCGAMVLLTGDRDLSVALGIAERAIQKHGTPMYPVVIAKFLR